MRQIIEYLPLIILFTPPVFQLIFSYRRIKGVGKLSIGETTAIALLLSAVLPILMIWLTLRFKTVEPDRINCGTVEAAVGIGTAMLDVILTFVIGLISWWIFATKKKNERLQAEHYVNS